MLNLTFYQNLQAKFVQPRYANVLHHGTGGSTQGDRLSHHRSLLFFDLFCTHASQGFRGLAADLGPEESRSHTGADAIDYDVTGYSYYDRFDQECWKRRPPTASKNTTFRCSLPNEKLNDYVQR